MRCKSFKIKIVFQHYQMATKWSSKDRTEKCPRDLASRRSLIILGTELSVEKNKGTLPPIILLIVCRLSFSCSIIFSILLVFWDFKKIEYYVQSSGMVPLRRRESHGATHNLLASHMNSNTKCTVIGARIEEHSLERRGGEEEHSRSFYKNNTKMCQD